MNINKIFKFEKRSCSPWAGCRAFDVVHRDSDDTVMDVTLMWGGFWQAHRNDKTFDASTRAAAVRGLVNRDLRLLVQ
jgi:hypothetical protein